MKSDDILNAGFYPAQAKIILEMLHKARLLELEVDDLRARLQAEPMLSIDYSKKERVTNEK